MASTTQKSPLLGLLSLLTTSIHTIEAELQAARMPPFSLEPKWHPLDSPDVVPSARLTEARKVAMGSAHMIRAIVQDVGTALFVRGDTRSVRLDGLNGFSGHVDKISGFGRAHSRR